MWTKRLWETLVRMTFGIFMGSLVLLLIILYSGVRSSDAKRKQ
jgi:hypothetical protein